jgi:bifunctional NMN adenylyltransferase/nudix hydrolase
MKKSQYCVYIGRFQPVTKAHMETVRRALDEAEKCILILGSAEAPLTSRNMFTLEERISLFKTALAEKGMAERVIIRSIPDSAYNFNAWTLRMQEIVNEASEGSDSVKIIGHFKDDSSYYLKHFPHWPLVKLDSLEGGISATDIRNSILEDGSWENHYEPLPATAQHIQKILEDNSIRLQELKEEFQFLKKLPKEMGSRSFSACFRDYRCSGLVYGTCTSYPSQVESRQRKACIAWWISRSAGHHP